MQTVIAALFYDTQHLIASLASLAIIFAFSTERSSSMESYESSQASQAVLHHMVLDLTACEAQVLCIFYFRCLSVGLVMMSCFFFVSSLSGPITSAPIERNVLGLWSIT